MGTSVKSFSVLAALMVAVVLGTCASGATAALQVENDLKDGNLTVLHPPGCCNYCTGEICPKVCEVCANVAVEKGKLVTLESRDGPYPLEYLKIQVQDEVYCVAEEDVKHLTSTALLQVAGGDCVQASPNSRFSARIVDEEVPGPPDSGRFEICLQLCDA